MDVVLAGVAGAFAPLNLAFIVLGVIARHRGGRDPRHERADGYCDRRAADVCDEPRVGHRVSARRAQGRRIRRRDLVDPHQYARRSVLRADGARRLPAREARQPAQGADDLAVRFRRRRHVRRSRLDTLRSAAGPVGAAHGAAGDLRRARVRVRVHRGLARQVARERAIRARARPAARDGRARHRNGRRAAHVRRARSLRRHPARRGRHRRAGARRDPRAARGALQRRAERSHSPHRARLGRARPLVVAGAARLRARDSARLA